MELPSVGSPNIPEGLPEEIPQVELTKVELDKISTAFKELGTLVESVAKEKIADFNKIKDEFLQNITKNPKKILAKTENEIKNLIISLTSLKVDQVITRKLKTGQTALIKTLRKITKEIKNRTAQATSEKTTRAVRSVKIGLGIFIGAAVVAPIAVVLGLPYLAVKYSLEGIHQIKVKYLTKRSDLKKEEESSKLSALRDVWRELGTDALKEIEKLKPGSSNEFSQQALRHEVLEEIEELEPGSPEGFRREEFEPGAPEEIEEPEPGYEVEGVPNEEIERLQPVLVSASELSKQELESDQSREIEQSKSLPSSSNEFSETDIRNFKAGLYSLEKILDTRTKFSDSENNKRFIDQFRILLRNPVYQALKGNSSPMIHLLHRFACAMWNETKALNAHTKLGEQLVPENAPQQALDFQVLTNSQTKANEIYRSENGKRAKVVYALTHPLFALSAMGAEGGVARGVAMVFGKGEYDPHRVDFFNNPWIQGKTTAQVAGEITSTVNNVYGGTPTIGDDEIAPEFLAVLQAARNNLSDKTPDPKIPKVIFYTNLQNIDSSGPEGLRSKAIMQLNEEYADVFMGITLSKDSEFYKNKEGDEKAWTTPNEFGEAMKDRLLDSASHTLTARKAGSAKGFYFPPIGLSWGQVFDVIISAANEHFKAWPEDLSLEESAEYRGAYQELVYSMIEDFIEISLMRENDSIMTIRACKENIDRGGAENLKFMYLRLEEDHPNRQAMLAGVMHGRALSVRDRPILEHRTESVLAFMKHVKPADYRALLQKAFPGMPEMSFVAST